ncbi:transcription factor bHLH94 [Cocos nucifera]|uniref:Transcription factor bHLH94 n=1 Tax=Cocos nucifera TaxID=13894 RepID=A0A8K0MX21_COCNU|nr:transcription factor bHLH94 [Cocos nucifera]
MALEAVVFPQDTFGYYTCKEWYAMGGGAWGYGFEGVGEEEEKGEVLECEYGGKGGGSWDPTSSSLVQNLKERDANSLLQEACEGTALEGEAAAAGRRKRRRAKSVKNKEEVESQRMIHIAVERNRRKQMNEYLAVLRSLMPPSYVQRGDQASIIGGAINYVKELEQLLQSLEVQKRLKQRSDAIELTPPFAGFFAFPQYSSFSSGSSHNNSSSSSSSSNNIANEAAAKKRSAMADIEVTMVESHANLKVLSRRRPNQLLEMVVGLQNTGLTTLHLNVTTVDQLVLYSFSLKVEDDCQFTSVDEIATAVYQMLGRIQEEANFN